MYNLVNPYLHHFRDIIVHNEKMLMLADNGNIYDLVTHKKILEIDGSVDVAALKDDNLVMVVDQHIHVYSLKTHRRRIIEKQIGEYSTAIYYNEILAVGTENGDIWLFGEDFVFLTMIKAGKEKIPVIAHNGTGIVAISHSGELIIYDYNSKKLITKHFGSKLTAMTVQKTKNDTRILLGDENGFVYFVNHDLSYKRIRISNGEIEYLYYHESIYCITEGFVRKINDRGAGKIYGTVCSIPTKVFSCNKKVFCTSVLVGIQPIVDRKNDFYDRIMKF
ncbi:putative WD40/YVTN repeat-like-containing domain, WD40 repeat-like-containing domain protein [Trachipleistophora hominis]|uniref:Putative WD40/YVTN repeat-like-containing domain, WD40 repeat-like-containing domain protein n=1 Tax=Trachipleistophora hominis TaxID=72359 RepID=L7JVW2_TRAHO|nr:putative WD40/YVTN repeat-like-containing domain, WD40 repeat-like-containing domain protein [Trachipleistophora hominis]